MTSERKIEFESYSGYIKVTEPDGTERHYNLQRKSTREDEPDVLQIAVSHSGGGPYIRQEADTTGEIFAFEYFSKVSDFTNRHQPQVSYNKHSKSWLDGSNIKLATAGEGGTFYYFFGDWHDLILLYYSDEKIKRVELKGHEQKKYGERDVKEIKFQRDGKAVLHFTSKYNEPETIELGKVCAEHLPDSIHAEMLRRRMECGLGGLSISEEEKQFFATLIEHQWIRTIAFSNSTKHSFKHEDTLEDFVNSNKKKIDTYIRRLGEKKSSQLLRLMDRQIEAFPELRERLASLRMQFIPKAKKYRITIKTEREQKLDAVFSVEASSAPSYLQDICAWMWGVEREKRDGLHGGEHDVPLWVAEERLQKSISSMNEGRAGAIKAIIEPLLDTEHTGASLTEYTFNETGKYCFGISCDTFDNIPFSAATTMLSELAREVLSKSGWHYLKKHPKANYIESIQRMSEVDKSSTRPAGQNELDNLAAALSKAIPGFSTPEVFDHVPTRDLLARKCTTKEELDSLGMFLTALAELHGLPKDHYPQSYEDRNGGHVLYIKAESFGKILAAERKFFEARSRTR